MKKKSGKIPDCGWGMSKRRYKKGHPGFKDVPGGTWEKIHKFPKAAGMYHGTKKPNKKGFFGEKYEWQELPDSKRLAAAKREWHESSRKNAWLAACFDYARSKGFVLIEKKHLDEAKESIRYGIHYANEMLSHPIPKARFRKIQFDISAMGETLKNISVK